jgi:uncharacterized membrane protein
MIYGTEMICSNCDAPMPDVSAFCPACGQSVIADESAASAPREKLLGALAYVGLLPAIVCLAIPALRDNRFIRFHSWQSMFFSVSSILMALALRFLFIIFSMLPVVGFLLAWLSLGIGSIGIVTLWVVLVVKAAQGQHYELPLIGPLAAQFAS